MKEAIVFGAGNIGRGFIGQLFSESSLRVTFLDVDRPLLDLLNQRGSYKLHAVFNDESTELTIGPVAGVLATDAAAATAAICQADIAATAVGARALPAVARTLAAGIAERARRQLPPLNVILCENLKNAAEIVRGMVNEHLDSATREYASTQVGFVDTVIGRMVPLQTAAQRAADPTGVRVEPYKELPVDRRGFKGELPKIVSMMPVDDFGVYTARKLYIHNCGHALFAYQGYLLGYELGYEALADARVRDFLFAGWEESLQGIVHHYGADPAWLRDHMDDLYRRFQNKALGDTIFRLARDPVRKLHPTDRLVAPTRLAEAAGVVPECLATAIAAAFCFDAPEDEVAVQLQARLKHEKLRQLLAEICEIKPDEPLAAIVEAHYHRLRRERQEQRHA